MRIFLTLLTLLNFLYANQRPTIALVLSGGGARGGAHVGVLKVLEEKKIPIDFIVGTSMGAFVGGLYASGKTPYEIEKMLISTDWEKHIRTDFIREVKPMRRKEAEYYYRGRTALGIDKNNNFTLPTGVLQREPMLVKYMQELEHVEQIKDFDKLPIPFRSVATNIRNGDAVVLKSGSLAQAIYASTAIPGGFQPINIDGVDLVDGGVSDNLPIGVAKNMGADIIIAVDVSENFSKDLDVNSYFVVMGQLINILMRKNVNQSIVTLSNEDILLTPDLDDFGGLNVDKYAEIIQRGVEITNKEYSTKLKQLSLNEIQYASYKQEHRYKEPLKEIIVSKIKINNKTNVHNDLILNKISLKEGEKLDKEKLRSEILSIYNTGAFDSINYEVVKKDDKNILQINATPSWNEDGEINFSFGFEDDFSGHSSYSTKAGYTMFGLNTYGGEWKNDFEIGKDKRIYTELFQPLNASKEYYIKGSLFYHDRNEYIFKTSSLNGGDVTLGIERYGGSVAVGTYVFTNIALEMGISAYKDNQEINLLNMSDNYNAVPMYASLNVDTLDNLNFPNTGVKSQIKWIKEDSSVGSDYDFEQIYIDFEKPISFGKHNIITYIKYGDTYKQNGAESVYSNFSLGGLFNLSGISSNYLNGENMFLAVMKYRYRIEDGGFFGSLSARVYAGLSAEIGNAWNESEDMDYNNMRKAGSVYLAADTILGPFYLAYGQADSSDSTIYLYLGERF